MPRNSPLAAVAFILIASFLIVFGEAAYCIAGDPVKPGPPLRDPTVTGQSSGPPLQLDVLILELKANNPELQAARKRYEAALTRPTQEGALPDPRVTLGWVSNGYPYPGAGLGTDPTSNIGIQFSQELLFPGKRALLSGIAREEAAAEAQAYRTRELDLVARAKERFYDLCLAYESMDLWRRNQYSLRQLAKVAEARYTVGKAAQQDLIKANIEVAIVENRLTGLEQKKLSLEAEIGALLNQATDSPLGRPTATGPLPSLAPLEAWQERAREASPTLQAQRAWIDSRQLNMQYAHKAYYPDFDVMSGYYNQGGMKPMWEFKVQMNIPLFFGRKQRAGLEEAGARLGEAQKSYRAAELALSAQVRIRHLGAEAARTLMERYSKQIVPQSELALESSLASYETGGVDFLSVLSNLNTIREYQLGHLEQQAEYLKALASLEELAGGNAGSPGVESAAKPDEVQR